MPLIACPACGEQVSSQAPTCPHCGHPIAEPLPVAPLRSREQTTHVVHQQSGGFGTGFGGVAVVYSVLWWGLSLSSRF